MQEFEEDYYAIMGVAEDVSAEDIRAAYIKLAKKLHPDRFPNDPDKRASAQAQFAKVTRAHDILSDSERRAEYDGFRKLLKERQGQALSPDGVTPAGSTPQVQILSEATKAMWSEKHLSRAEELLRAGNIQRAEAALKDALRMVPQDPRLHVKLAEVYIARGWKTLAATEIQTALRHDPKNSDAKMLELKLKAMERNQSAAQPKKGLMDQLKDMFKKDK